VAADDAAKELKRRERRGRREQGDTPLASLSASSAISAFLPFWIKLFAASGEIFAARKHSDGLQLRGRRGWHFSAISAFLFFRLFF